MLVLTRHIGEEIMIGEQIRLVVVGIGGGRVRLGVCAPPTVLVDRMEVRARRTMEQRLGVDLDPLPRVPPPSRSGGIS